MSDGNIEFLILVVIVVTICSFSALIVMGITDLIEKKINDKTQKDKA